MIGSPLDFPSSNNPGTMAQASPGKLDRLHRAPAGSTALALMDLDFAISGPLVRPRMPHTRFLFVRSRLCSALPSDATSGRRPRMTPLCFASPSPPSGWTGDLHPHKKEPRGPDPRTTRSSSPALTNDGASPLAGGHRGHCTRAEISAQANGRTRRSGAALVVAILDLASLGLSAHLA